MLGLLGQWISLSSSYVPWARHHSVRCTCNVTCLLLVDIAGHIPVVVLGESACSAIGLCNVAHTSLLGRSRD